MKADRIKQARFLAENGFIYVQRRDKDGRPIVLLTPGHEGRLYHVVLKRSPDGKSIRIVCDNVIGDSFVRCPGSAKTVCFHGLAALIVVAKEHGADISICKNRIDAIRRRNLGGKVYTVWSQHSNRPMWIVVEEPELEAEQV